MGCIPCSVQSLAGSGCTHLNEVDQGCATLRGIFKSFKPSSRRLYRMPYQHSIQGQILPMPFILVYPVGHESDYLSRLGTIETLRRANLEKDSNLERVIRDETSKENSTYSCNAMPLLLNEKKGTPAAMPMQAVSRSLHFSHTIQTTMPSQI